MSRPVIAVVGRPNVGKSTFFNRMIGERHAIVEDTPGITRDRLYGTFDWNGREFSIIDTGGILRDEPDPILRQAREQAGIAIEEADLILFLTDGRDGLTAADLDLAEELRRSPKPVLLVVNKMDSARRELELPEFYTLGLGEPFPVSSIQGHGVADVLDKVVEALPAAPEVEDEEDQGIRIAIIGRPNVGKSSLMNTILGEERAIVSSVPGTTRDAIDTPFERDGQRFVLVDTAGIRRAGKIQGSIEYYTVLRAQRALDRSDVALVVLDAADGVTDGDTRVGGMADEAGRASVLVVNKWDLVKGVQMHRYAETVKERFQFMDYAPVAFASAQTGRGLGAILDTAQTVAANHSLRIPTAELNRVVREAVSEHPYSHKGRALKVRYVTQPATRPPLIIVFVNNPLLVHFSYERYLMNRLRQAFGFVGTPVRLSFRRSDDKDDE